LSISGNTAICEGESVQLNSSATDADSYLWTTTETTADVSVSPTQQTTYSLTVSNACGEATDQVTIEVNPAPAITASPDEEICEGESVELASSGVGSILWQPGGEITGNITVSPVNMTTYSVSATNDCGVVSEDIEVVVNPLPTQPVISVNGSGLESTVGSSYQWYLNGNSIEGETNQTYLPTQAGDYTVEISDGNGCSSISEPYNWITVGIAELEFDLSVYPNPFNNQLVIVSDAAIQLVEIIDLSGRLVFCFQPNASRVELDTEDWANGVYFLQGETQNGQFVLKVLKAG
jgi:hypothetical protein